MTTQNSQYFWLNEVISRLHALETASPTHSPRPYLPCMNLDVPKFSGTNTPAWIFKISQFLDYHHTLEDEHLQVALFYIEGTALSWFQWMYSNNQLSSWVSFF